MDALNSKVITELPASEVRARSKGRKEGQSQKAQPRENGVRGDGDRRSKGDHRVRMTAGDHPPKIDCSYACRPLSWAMHR